MLCWFIFCVCKKHVHMLFWKQIETQDTDNIKQDVAEIVCAIVYLWQVHQHCIYLFWPSGLKYTHCVQKNFHRNTVHEKYFLSSQIYELYRIHYNLLGQRKVLPHPMWLFAHFF